MFTLPLSLRVLWLAAPVFLSEPSVSQVLHPDAFSACDEALSSAQPTRPTVSHSPSVSQGGETHSTSGRQGSQHHPGQPCTPDPVLHRALHLLLAVVEIVFIGLQ